MAYKHLKFPENSLFLVTGAAGFIGSNLCEAILNMGYRVRALDDLSTGKQENIDLFIDNPNYEFMKGDIKDLDTCFRACQGVDYVLNQAAWGSVPRSIEMPLFYSLNNIQGTLNMLEAARQKGVKKFVYASSSSVYGDEPNLPKKEDRVGNLLSPYAVTKRTDEEWAKQYTMHYGLDTYGMRYLISEFKCYQWVDAYARYCIGYDSPFAVGMAFCLFGFFYKMKVGGGLSFIVTKLSPSIFSVYLLHDTSSANFGRWLIGLIEHFLYSQYANVPFAIIGAAIGVFFTCCLIDSLRRGFLLLITLARKRAKMSPLWGF